MRFAKLHQPPFETTMMGALKAALDHFGHSWPDAAVYGGSGHAFVVNVHEALCPSGPYRWQGGGMDALLENLGVARTDLGFFHSGTSPEDRAAVEAVIREHLDAGRPCSLCNMDHQVIDGYDEDGFFTARPWPNNPDYPPGRLTFGTWAEFGDEIHVNFFSYEGCEPAAASTVFRDALAYAVGLFSEPGRHEFEKYSVGLGAYDLWAAAVQEYGSTHGNWWNGTVWSECRARAADWFAETAATLDGERADLALSLADRYRAISGLLTEIADKALPAERKREIALELRECERDAIAEVESLLVALAD